METILTKQPAISVIVPIFNAARHLERCLNSLIGQTLKNIEIICINDGSTDGSSDILKSYAAADTRITIINQANSGQSAARNAGIKRASGQYIGFVDADDYVDSDFYEKLYQNASESDAEIIQASTRRTGNRRTKIQKHQPLDISDFATAVKKLNHGAVWDKIFHTEMIKRNHISFIEGYIYEDNLFVVQALWFGKKMKIINTTCYNYIFNSQSTTTDPQKEQKRQKDSLAVAAMIIDFARQKNMSNTEIKQLRHFILNNFISLKHLNEPEYYHTLQKAINNDTTVFLYKCRQNFKKTFKNFRHKIKEFFR